MRSKKRSKVFAVAVVVTVAAAALTGLAAPSASAAAPKGSTIVFGSIETQTSPTGGKITTTGDTLNAWVKWTNAHGGIAGHPVKVIVKDDKADPAQASAALKELVEQDHAVAIVGQNAPATADTWKTYVEQQQVPVLGGAEYSTIWFTSPMYYPVSGTFVTTIYAQAFAAKDAGKKKYASILCANLSVCQGAAQVVKQQVEGLGMQFVYSGFADQNAASYTPQCLAAKDAGADVLSPQGVNQANVVRDCSRQNYNPTYISTNFSYTLQQIKNTPAFEGNIGPTPSISPYESFAVTKDRDAAIKKYAPQYSKGGKLYTTTGLLPLSDSWEAAEAFKLAVERSGVAANATVTNTDIIKGLATFNQETLNGSNPPLSYGDGTKANAQVKCFYLYKIKNGNYVSNTKKDPKTGQPTPTLYCES